jgi:hypothetical protein
MSATAAASTPVRANAPGAHDRLFYSSMAVVMALTVFAGFAPTYYLRASFGAPVTVSGSAVLTPLVHVHAVLFSAWVLLFIAQTTPVATRRVSMARQGITVTFWPSMHPASLRCSSVECTRHSPSSRLAIRVPRRPERPHLFHDGP